MIATKLYPEAERLIAECTGAEASIVHRTPVGGGCISNAEKIDLADGRCFCLKHNAHVPRALFEQESEALAALTAPKAIRVPEPLAVGGGEAGIPPFIILEWIESGTPGADFHLTFGRQFAELHKATQSDRFGFPHDNHIGSTPQPNGWKDDWVEFWREHRLGYQFKLARDKGLTNAVMNDWANRLLERLPELIGEPDEPACLLHGDLWGGNYMTDADGQPVLIDPAAYYGRREADLAMTMLFGGFSHAFYQGYEEVWPLAEGSKTRLDIYKLYHLLNHLNLFGSSYRGGCMEIMSRYGG